ncbi:hypothetical protein [Raineyella fluvialis]|uniref:Uncharacterized protein n=1 Tax=Raineyella fluvialis TaxID=2662261 RepID=A0A5Q2F8F9_9ACTN|nr:hypothetical protein [Raineyella fluvialis]QGF23172.1 hypothetical protein Rai3103_05300 [Raineyella fluvialis]
MARSMPGIGMRAKLAAATMAIVGMALVVGTGIVSLALYTALMSSVTREATSQLSAVADLIGREGLDGLSGETGAEVAMGATVQLIDAGGSLVYSSGGTPPSPTPDRVWARWFSRGPHPCRSPRRTRTSSSPRPAWRTAGS